ncbi:MAG: hypothetical protein AAGM22_19930 [Acidobacteriota bacterium]
MFFLSVLRSEFRLQWRSLRFRVGTALYLFVACSPPFALAFLIQPQAPLDFGAASYLGWTLDLARFSSLILATVVAGNRVDESSQRQLWPVLAAAGLGNGGYLWRRWAAMAVILAVITAIPPAVAWAVAAAQGLPQHDPLTFLGGWLFLLVPVVAVQSATWLALTTIAGSELGALMLFYLVLLGSDACTTKVLEPHTGSTFSIDRSWVGFNNFQWGTKSILDLSKKKWSLGQQLRSEGHFNWDQAFDWWTSRTSSALAGAALLLTLAIGFVRRTRGDIRPLVLREGHPLRNLLRFVHAARARYTPDAALRSEWWRFALGLGAMVGAVLFHHHLQSDYEDLAAQQYAVQTETDDQPSTPFHLVATKRTVRGDVMPTGKVQTTTVIHFENRGETPAPVVSLSSNLFLEVEASVEAGARSLSIRRRANRLFLEIEPPVPPGGELSVRVDLFGTPKLLDFRLRGPWGRSSSFALRYRQHLRGRHRHTDLARSSRTPLVSRRRMWLGAGALTPTVRYTTWQLTDPPAVRGERGLELPAESVQPIEDMEIDLGLPPGVVAADACANASVDEAGEPQPRLRGVCRLSPADYQVFGGPFQPVAVNGGVTLVAQAGHDKQILDQLPAIQEVLRLSADAWPGLEPVESLAAIEWPAAFQFGERHRSSQLYWDPIGGWSADSPQIYGRLMAIPETRLMLREPISSEELVGRLLTTQISERRPIVPKQQRIFRMMISTAMAHRMGLSPATGATLTGKPWGKYWAAQPILSEDQRRHLKLAPKVRALTLELIARTGAAAFYDGVNRFQGAHAEGAAEGDGTLEELFAYLEPERGSLQDFWDQYFTETEALPEMRLGEFSVRRVGERYVVRGELKNDGFGDGRCPVVIKADGQTRTVIVTAGTKSVETFEVTLDREPLSALLDPDKVCYRWVGPGTALAERKALQAGPGGAR